MKKILILVLFISPSLYGQDLSDFNKYIGEYKQISYYFIRWNIKDEYKDLSSEEVLQKVKDGILVYEKEEYLEPIDETLFVKEVYDSQNDKCIELWVDNRYQCCIDKFTLEYFYENPYKGIIITEMGILDDIKFISDDIIVIENTYDSDYRPNGIFLYRMAVYKKLTN